MRTADEAVNVPTRGGGIGCLVIAFVVLVPVVLILGVVLIA